MFEAYSVAIRVSLINGVTSGLMNISRAFLKAHGDAAKLQRQLDSIKFRLVAGAALAGTGLFGLSLIEKTIPAAREYAHQLNIMNMAGLKQAEIAKAVGAAWANTNTVVTTTATQNLKALLDLRNVLGSMDEARMALPIVSKIGAVMSSSSEGGIRNHADDIAFSMAKALDIIGAARDPATFQREAALMSKVVTAFQNRVTPRQFQSVFQYARQAKYDLSDEFKYEFLPSLMLEMSSGAGSQGGGSRGVGPMLAAIYRVTNQGYVSKKAIPVLSQLGLLASNDYVKTTTTGTVGVQLKGRDLAAQNPFLWNQQVLVPAIMRMLGPNATPQQVRGVINSVFAGNQLAASAMTEFYTKPQNFLRDQRIIRGAMPYGQAYDQAKKNDPNFQYAALLAQWTNVKTQLGLVVLPALISGTVRLTAGLRALSGWMQAHPNLTTGLVAGFTALSAAMAFGGVAIMLGAAFSAIGLVLPVLAGGFGVIAGVAAAVSSGIVAIGAALGGAALAAAPVVLPLVLITGAIAGLGLIITEIASHWDKNKSIWGNIKAEFSMFITWVWDKVKWLLNKIPGVHIGEPGTPPPKPRPYNPRLDFNHPDAMRPAASANWNRPDAASPFIAPPRLQKQSFTGDVHMDGQKVGEVVWRHQSDALDRAAAASPSSFDDRAALSPVALGYVA